MVIDLRRVRNLNPSFLYNDKQNGKSAEMMFCFVLFFE
jgi:hypothetical protein